MKRILLVEDNEMNRDMMSRLLSRWGYEVVTAVDGVSAVAMVVSMHPDLVFMDISLPGIDGYEATTRIRALPEGQELPIIALTAHITEEDRERALAAGCSDFETKPIDFLRLEKKLETLLRSA
jgi:two-component system, cell cycle response regulator DivK